MPWREHGTTVYSVVGEAARQVLGKVVQTECSVVQSSGARLEGELFVRLSVLGLSEWMLVAEHD